MILSIHFINYVLVELNVRFIEVEDLAKDFFSSLVHNHLIKIEIHGKGKHSLSHKNDFNHHLSWLPQHLFFSSYRRRRHFSCLVKRKWLVAIFSTMQNPIQVSLWFVPMSFNDFFLIHFFHFSISDGVSFHS